MKRKKERLRETDNERRKRERDRKGYHFPHAVDDAHGSDIESAGLSAVAAKGHVGSSLCNAVGHLEHKAADSKLKYSSQDLRNDTQPF